MDDALYREEILEHYKRPHNWGPMEHPDLEAADTNPLCGDELKVMLRVAPDRTIADVRFDGHGCAISQASASMISDEVIGMPRRRPACGWTAARSSSCSGSTSRRRA